MEFLRKEAADNALTLDGTSFMSRIIKASNLIINLFALTSFADLIVFVESEICF